MEWDYVIPDNYQYQKDWNQTLYVKFNQISKELYGLVNHEMIIKCPSKFINLINSLELYWGDKHGFYKSNYKLIFVDDTLSDSILFDDKVELKILNYYDDLGVGLFCKKLNNRLDLYNIYVDYKILDKEFVLFVNNIQTIIKMYSGESEYGDDEMFNTVYNFILSEHQTSESNSFMKKIKI